jgi:hypothetical protein
LTGEAIPLEDWLEESTPKKPEVGALSPEDTVDLESGYTASPVRMRNVRVELENEIRGTVPESENVVPVEPTVFKEGIGPDISLTEMMNEIMALKITKYNYLDSNGSVYVRDFDPVYGLRLTKT